MAGNRRWTSDEIDELKQNYSSSGVIYLSAKLNRSIDAIHWKASQLGIPYGENNIENIIARLKKIEKRLDTIERIMDL